MLSACIKPLHYPAVASLLGAIPWLGDGPAPPIAQGVISKLSQALAPQGFQAYGCLVVSAGFRFAGRGAGVVLADFWGYGG